MLKKMLISIETAKVLAAKIDQISAAHGVVAPVTITPYCIEVNLTSGGYDIFGDAKWYSKCVALANSDSNQITVLNEGNDYLAAIVAVLREANWNISDQQYGRHRQAFYWRINSCSPEVVAYQCQKV